MAKKKNDQEGVSDIANELNRAAQSTQPVVKALDTISTKLTLIAKIIAGIDVKDSVAAIEQLGSASEKSAKGADALTTSTQALAAANASLEEKSNIAGKAMGKLGSALSGIKSFVGTATGFLGTMGGAVTGLIGGVFDLSKAIINIPLTMFNKLEEAAGKMRERGVEIANAWEDVRKTFGDLNSTIPKTIAHMRTSGEGAKATGLSMFRVFGDVPEQIRAINQAMSDMGPIAEVMQDEFERNGQALLYFQKGLGLSNEQQKKMAELAKSSGKTLTSLYIDLEKQSQGLAEAAGLNAKTLSRDIADAMTDVTTYAGMTTKEIGAAVARVKSLGVAIKDVAGINQAFKTFDTASQNAAKLGQAFGVVVNGFEMMKAKSPADKIEILRKAMFAAGKSAESMDARQLELLGSTSGLSPEIAKQVFSMKNQGKSYEDIQKAADKSAKKHMTQEEALGKLSSSIERLHKVMSQSTSYFGNFFDGMTKGIAQSGPMAKLLSKMGGGFQVAAAQGRKFGAMLVATIPGLETMINALADMLDPEKIKEFFGIFSDSIKLFNKGEISFGGLIDKIFGGFDSVYKKTGEARSAFATGFLEFTKFILKGFVGAFRAIADYIKKPENLMSVAEEGGTETGKSFLDELMDSFKDAGKQLGEIWDGVWPYIRDKILFSLEDLWNFISPSIKKGAKTAFHDALDFLWEEIQAHPIWAGLGGLFLAGKFISGLSNLKKGMGDFFSIFKRSKEVASGSKEMAAGVKELGTGVGQGLAGFFKALASKEVAGGILVATLGLAGLAAGIFLIGKAFENSADGWKVFGELIKDFGTAIGNTAPLILAAFQGIGTVIESVGKSIATVIEAIAGGVVKIIEGLVGSLKNLNELNPANLLALAGSITALGVSLVAFAGGSAIAGIVDGLGKLFGVDPVSNLKRFETIDIAKLDGVSATLKTLSSSLAYFSEVTGKVGISDVFSKIGEVIKTAGSGLADAFNVFGPDIKSVGDSIQSFGIEDNLAALQSVVKKVSEFDMLLDDINSSKLNVQAKLDTFMKKAGITALAAESSKNFNLNKKVNIKLDLKVVMDANRVEQVILQRTDSQIRNIFMQTNTGISEGDIPDDPNFNGPTRFNTPR